ncbi:MAG: hypothetical protein JNL32_13660, partial [Candidatus Kapabacteria bacterium]|nr:hypothetical protein [Candidatus Kapabacteria bacterium]
MPSSPSRVQPAALVPLNYSCMITEHPYSFAIAVLFTMLLASCSVAQQRSLTDKGSDKCTFSMVLEGQEPLSGYGLDSTKNWWATTTPFTGMTRLYINGKPTKPYQEIRRPLFSHDGNHWAAWAMMNNLWHVLLDGVEQPVQCTSIGTLVFSGASQQLVYSYYDGTQEVIVCGQRKYSFIGRSSNVYVSPNAERVAFTIGQTGLKSLMVNNKQSTAFDDILPIGF